MSELNTRSTLHKRMSNFVDWVRSDANTRDSIKERRNNVQKNIRNKAEADGVIVTQTPNAGSFATHTGLRRHYRGNAEVDGQDVDIPFVVKDETEDGQTLDELINRFKRYAQDSYPDTEIKTTKSSVKLLFADNVHFDLVPMIAVDSDDYQEIIRSNGERIETSVRKHVQFIKSRNKSSNAEEGRVKFNECIRLLKWWRDYQASKASNLNGKDAPPSFLINLLAAEAYDKKGVDTTYAETLHKWFAYLAHIVDKRKPILFTDYNVPSEDEQSDWTVMDPVNSTNNVVKNWSRWEIEELTDWFKESRDEFSRIVRHTENGKDNDALKGLVKIFGTSFQNHCES